MHSILSHSAVHPLETMGRRRPRMHATDRGLGLHRGRFALFAAAALCCVMIPIALHRYGMYETKINSGTSGAWRDEHIPTANADHHDGLDVESSEGSFFAAIIPSGRVLFALVAAVPIAIALGPTRKWLLQGAHAALLVGVLAGTPWLALCVYDACTSAFWALFALILNRMDAEEALACLWLASSAVLARYVTNGARTLLTPAMLPLWIANCGAGYMRIYRQLVPQNYRWLAQSQFRALEAFAVPIGICYVTLRHGVLLSLWLAAVIVPSVLVISCAMLVAVSANAVVPVCAVALRLPRGVPRWFARGVRQGNALSTESLGAILRRLLPGQSDERAVHGAGEAVNAQRASLWALLDRCSYEIADAMNVIDSSFTAWHSLLRSWSSTLATRFSELRNTVQSRPQYHIAAWRARESPPAMERMQSHMQEAGMVVCQIIFVWMPLLLIASAAWGGISWTAVVVLPRVIDFVAVIAAFMPALHLPQPDLLVRPLIVLPSTALRLVHMVVRIQWRAESQPEDDESTQRARRAYKAAVASFDAWLLQLFKSLAITAGMAVGFCDAYTHTYEGDADALGRLSPETDGDNGRDDTTTESDMEDNDIEPTPYGRLTCASCDGETQALPLCTFPHFLCSDCAINALQRCLEQGNATCPFASGNNPCRVREDAVWSVDIALGTDDEGHGVALEFIHQMRYGTYLQPSANDNNPQARRLTRIQMERLSMLAKHENDRRRVGYGVLTIDSFQPPEDVQAGGAASHVHAAWVAVDRSDRTPRPMTCGRPGCTVAVCAQCTRPWARHVGLMCADMERVVDGGRRRSQLEVVAGIEWADVPVNVNAPVAPPRIAGFVPCRTEGYAEIQGNEIFRTVPVAHAWEVHDAGGELNDGGINREGEELAGTEHVPTPLLYKPCPECHMPVQHERNNGCHHLTCPECTTQWCWVCNGRWFLPDRTARRCTCPMTCSPTCTECPPRNT